MLDPTAWTDFLEIESMYTFSLKTFSLSIHFHFLWFVRQVWWRSLKSDQKSRRHIYIEWTAFLLLSYQMASTVFKLYILILDLHIQGQDNFLLVLCDSQAPVARSRGMKKSPGPRTRWTWQQCPLMVTQPWIWSDLIRSEVGQHNTTLCHTAT